MVVITLRRVDDAVRDYWAYHDATCIGEVRPRAWGTSELHMADGRYLLRRDDTADALKKQAGIARALLRMATFGARYSLRDGDRVLARAERCFSLSTRRDSVRLQPDADAAHAWTLARTGGPDAPWPIAATDGVVGCVESLSGGRDFAWHGPAVPAPVAVFSLYALHQQFGTHPSSGADGGDGGD